MHFSAPGRREAVAHDVRDHRMETAVGASPFDQQAALRQRITRGGGMKPGDPVLIISSEPMLFWPFGDQAGLKWTAPVYSYWMLPAIGAARIHGARNQEIEQLADAIRDQTARNIRCYQPKLILIERKRFYAMQPEKFNVAAFFLENTSFRTIIYNNYNLKNYNNYLLSYKLNQNFKLECDII